MGSYEWVTSPSIWVAVIVTLLITNQEGPYKLLLRHEVPTTMITIGLWGSNSINW